jgi:hypothetical protein
MSGDFILDHLPLGEFSVGSLATLGQIFARLVSLNKIQSLSEIGRQFRQPVTFRSVTLSNIWRQKVLPHKLDAFRVWTEQRCTSREWHALHKKLAGARAKQRPPLPEGYPGMDIQATIIRSWIDDAAQALEFGDVEKASQYYDKARAEAADVELNLRDNPPRLPQGRPKGSYMISTETLQQKMPDAVRKIRTKGEHPSENRVMALMGYQGDAARAKEWAHRLEFAIWEDFLDSVRTSAIRNSITYRRQHSRKSKFSTEPKTLLFSQVNCMSVTHGKSIH